MHFGPVEVCLCMIVYVCASALSNVAHCTAVAAMRLRAKWHERDDKLTLKYKLKYIAANEHKIAFKRHLRSFLNNERNLLFLHTNIDIT